MAIESPFSGRGWIIQIPTYDAKISRAWGGVVIGPADGRTSQVMFSGVLGNESKFWE